MCRRVINLISWVTNYSLILALNFSLIYNNYCACEITKLQWQSSIGVAYSETQGSQLGWETRRDESFQARAEEPLGTDSHQTISKQSSECWLLIICKF